MKLTLALASLVIPALSQAADAPAVGACVIGSHAGIPDVDAGTAASIVCDELGRHGIRLGPPVLEAPGSGPVYRVDLRKLGDSVYLGLSRGSPPGEQRSVQLARLEEVPVAAPRLVEALVKGTDVAATARVDNLIGQETREYEKKHGEFFWAVGLAGFTFPGLDAALGTGFEVKAFYETPDLGVGMSLRGGGTPDSGCYDNGEACQNSASMIAWSLGGRYFFGDGDFSPFAGGGLSALWLDVSGKDSKEGGGLGAYGEIGVELLRLHDSRVSIDLRLDVPFFTMEDRYDGWYDEFGVEQPEGDGETLYALPVSFGATYAW